MLTQPSEVHVNTFELSTDALDFGSHLVTCMLYRQVEKGRDGSNSQTGASGNK